MSYLTVGVGLGELMSALEAGPHMQLATALSLPYNPVAMHHAKVTLLQKLARLFVLPTLPLVVLANSGSRFSPGLLESIGLYIAFVLVNIWTTAGVQEWLISRRAHKAGAVCAPKVKGKWIGNIDVMRTFISRLPNEIPGTYLDEVLDEMHVNTVHLNVLGGQNYFTRDPAVIKAILTETDDGHLVFEKGKFLDGILGDLLNSGIFNSDGAMWKAHRAMTRPYFAKERISDFDTFAKHTENLIKAVKRCASSSGASVSHNNGAVEIQDLFGRMTIDTALEFLMGTASNSLHDVPVETEENRQTNASRFLFAFNEAQHNCHVRTRTAEIWPLFELIGSRNAEPMKIINGFVEGVIQEALNKPRRVKAGSSTEEGTLLDHMIQETRDPEILRNQVLNILLAARDTTQSTLTSAVYVLARQPETLKRLRAEVLDTVGKDANPTYDDVREMKYLRAFLNEILRLFPPVPFNIRSATRDTVIIADGKPLFVPKDFRMSFAIINTHRRTDLWGPDAAKFDPDRWIDDRLSYYKRQPFIFTPFSAGPRICLGQQFAYQEASFCLIKLLQAFNSFSIDYSAQPQESRLNGTEDTLLTQSQITLFFKGGLWVRLGEDVSEK